MIRFFRVFVPVGALALLFSEILLIASCFLVVTFLFLRSDPLVYLLTGNGLLHIAVVVASLLFGLFFEDLYTQIYVRSRVLLGQQLCLVVGIALLLQGFLGYVRPGFRLPLRVMLPSSVLVLAALFAWRIVYSREVLRVVGAQRILFVGRSPLVEEMARYIAGHPQLGLCAVGYLEDSAEGDTEDAAGKRLGPLNALQSIAAAVRPDRIVVGMTERRGRTPISDLLQLRYTGMPVEEAAGAYEQMCGRALLTELHPSQLLLSDAFRAHSERLAYQTLANWLLALFLALLTAPLLLLTAMLLKLSSRGPLLRRRPRSGLGGKPFQLYTFRLPASDGRVRRFITRWRLDDLPQLWSVLQGHMAFVGPRPDRPEFLAPLSALIPFYPQRCRVKPGLTGWAQINLSPDQPEDTLRRLEYDFYYLKNSSRGLDTYILTQSLKNLLMYEPPG
jgi:lipopolysaccharide/colanic/teichoic acid biosynthesis glycosyltransferase